MVPMSKHRNIEFNYNQQCKLLSLFFKIAIESKYVCMNVCNQKRGQLTSLRQQCLWGFLRVFDSLW